MARIREIAQSAQALGPARPPWPRRSPELWVAEGPRLLAEAAQRLAMLVHERMAAFGARTCIPRQPKGQPRRLALCSYGRLCGRAWVLGLAGEGLWFHGTHSVSLTPVMVVEQVPDDLPATGAASKGTQRSWPQATVSRYGRFDLWRRGVCLGAVASTGLSLRTELRDEARGLLVSAP